MSSAQNEGRMVRQDWSWHSPHLQREMGVARWGTYGKPVLLFPTSGADHLDVWRFKLVEVLRPLIESERIKLYTCRDNSRDTWVDLDMPPWKKAAGQAAFDRYLVDELLPHIREDCRGTEQRFACAGASLGGYQAVTAAAKHPDWFDLAVGMSGFYDLDVFMDRHRDENYYFNNALYFVPNLPEGRLLQRLQTTRFVIAGGTGKWEHPDQGQRMARVLASKGVPVKLELWGAEWNHDWPTWRAMLPSVLDRMV